MSFDWWHPECTGICFIIVTIVENHRLIIDICVSKQTKIQFSMTFDQNNFKEIFWIVLKYLEFMLLNQFDSVVTNIHSNQRLGLLEFSDLGHMIVK